MAARSRGGCAALLAAALAGCSPQAEHRSPASASSPRPAAAPVQLVDGPMLAMPDLMALVIDPAAGVLGPAFHRDPLRQPHTPEAWQAVADAAAELERSASVLEQPGWSLGRAEWLRAVAELRDGTRAGAEAAKRRDAQRLALAAQRLQVACDGCHAHYAPALR